ncbi:MAG: beta-cyclase [Bdellovibrionaceae bacterium]|nr:beta-cyclase [Pseudobdellovibrionaceae bacterium]|tara:strand:- start:1343 stop:2083 length:741 start_codon:yes stop_codon:yes gene_type:complete
MTYLNFLVIFVIPLVIVGWIYFFKTQYISKSLIKVGLLILVFLAVIYTTPWDNYLVKNEIWWYGPDRVLGTLGFVPIEEYFFFVLQTLATGFWTYFLMTKIKVKLMSGNFYNLQWMVTLLLFFVFFLGVYLISIDRFRYLSLILVWATPVLLLQWGVGGRALIQNGFIYLVALFIPSFYFCFIDLYAIEESIWKISPVLTTGVLLFKLPIEEAIFFFVTNLMVVQGLVLLVSMRNEKMVKKYFLKE